MKITAVRRANSFSPHGNSLSLEILGYASRVGSGPRMNVGVTVDREAVRRLDEALRRCVR